MWNCGWLDHQNDKVNSLWPGDAIWWYRTGSTLLRLWLVVQKIAPSHYLNQCWIIIREVLWHSSEGNFTRNAKDIYPGWAWKSLIKISEASPRSQRVKKKKFLKIGIRESLSILEWAIVINQIKTISPVHFSSRNAVQLHLHTLKLLFISSHQHMNSTILIAL